MSRHSTEDLEALKSAPKDRYRAEVRRRGRWTYEVQLVTTHTLRLPRGPALEPTDEPPIERLIESVLQVPPMVLGARWARWKARRMVAAAKRRDVREQQPWVETG